jgi:hypothetical protein
MLNTSRNIGEGSPQRLTEGKTGSFLGGDDQEVKMRERLKRRVCLGRSVEAVCSLRKEEDCVQRSWRSPLEHWGCSAPVVEALPSYREIKSPDPIPTTSFILATQNVKTGGSIKGYQITRV